MRVLVTGARGFVGRHLVRALRDSGHAVVEATRDGVDGTEALELPDPDGASLLMRRVQPEAVFHLAAIAEVPAADRDPQKALRVNVDGTAHLLEGARQEAPTARFFFVSSSNVYGVVPAIAQPIRENRGYAPAGVYAASKVAAECWVRSYERLLAVPPVILRPFNHVGSGQSSSYALPAFARQIVDIENGATPLVSVGNLQVRRDILDVRDVVRAYAELLAVAKVPSPLNVCGGRSYVMADLLDALCGLSTANVKVDVDPARLRPNDLEVLEGDPTRLHDCIGWEPEVPIEDTLQSLLDDWRSRVCAPKGRS